MICSRFCLDNKAESSVSILQVYMIEIKDNAVSVLTSSQLVSVARFSGRTFQKTLCNHLCRSDIRLLKNF